ncbi:MAG: hypothetical protein ACLFV7_00720 [Phycisphaerae bacterium]
MRRNQSQRGSALMLTIGLLSILVMLGATFLVVSHLDAKEAEAVITRNQSVPVASGVVFRAMEILKRDLYTGDIGPFGDPRLAMDRGAVMAYEDAAFLLGAKYSTRYLHDMHLSYQDPNTAYYSLLYPMEILELNETFDVDDDGAKDGYLLRGESVSSMGQQYWIAAKVVDLAGRACINTGGRDVSATDAVVPRSPILYDLRALLNNATAYNDIHQERCGGKSGVGLEKYYYECGRRLLVPNSSQGVSYRPFAVGDEMPLHYMNDDSIAVKSGRLFDVIRERNLSDTLRKQLTTYSCTRKLLRWPKKADQSLALLDVSSASSRQELYEYALTMLEGAGIADSALQNRMAVTFVANFWAYYAKDNQGKPWKFSAGGATAYGLKQDLVITEAYAAHKPEEVKDSADHIAGFAVELFNPTDKDIGLNGYKLKLDDKTETVSLSGNVPANGYAVLYSYVEGDNYSGNFGTDNDRKNHTGLDPGSNWYELGKSNDNQKIDFTKVDRVLLLDGGVPVDEVLDDDGLNYGNVNIQTESGGKKSIQRDDHPDRHRFNIAEYATKNDHALGKVNGLDADELMPDLINGAPIVDIDSIDDQDDLLSVAELGRVYLAGTTVQDGKTRVFSKAIIEEKDSQPIFPDVPGRGRLNFLLADVPEVSRFYPRIPVGCLTGEFFTVQKGDQTRPDDLRRYYGLINVNNAYWETLRNLPWPKTVKFDGKNIAIDADKVVDEMIRYRESPNRDEWGTGLRKLSRFRGFYSPGEIAIPLAAYMNRRLGCSGNFPKPDSNINDLKIVLTPDYLEARDALYRAVADLVTVRSDTFAVVIHVQVGEDVPAKYSWKYLAIIDRSNVNDPEDTPAVILFTPLK